jgi:hypothetical protein
VKHTPLVGRSKPNKFGKAPKREKFPNELGKKLAPARTLSGRH